MNHRLAHLGAPAAAIAIAALVSAAAVLGARVGAPQPCARAGIPGRGAAAPGDARKPDPVAPRSTAWGDAEQHLAFTRARLAITPEQAPHWQAFAGAVRDRSLMLDEAVDVSAAAIEPVSRHARPIDSPSIDRVAVVARAASEKQFAAAWAALYDRLTDEQKTIAASLLIRHDGRPR